MPRKPLDRRWIKSRSWLLGDCFIIPRLPHGECGVWGWPHLAFQFETMHDETPAPTPPLIDAVRDTLVGQSRFLLDNIAKF